MPNQTYQTYCINPLINLLHQWKLPSSKLIGNHGMTIRMVNAGMFWLTTQSSLG